MARPLVITRASSGYMTSGTQTCRPSPEFTQTVLLTASTVKAVTVPVNNSNRMAAFFLFTAGADVFYCPTATPTLTVPTGTVTLSTNELIVNGSGREVVGGQKVQLLTPDTGVYVTIAYYAIPD